MSLGLGVMIGLLAGRQEDALVLQEAIGKEIAAIEFFDDTLFLEFTDKTKISIFDGGQSCCEERYMHTDDALADFVGATLMDLEIRDVPNLPAEYGDHEVQFLLITTSKGVFTMETHNEHNGYYGGFLIRVSAVE